MSGADEDGGGQADTHAADARQAASPQAFLPGRHLAHGAFGRFGDFVEGQLRHAAARRMLAFDFDGTIVDTARESFVSSAKAYEEMTNEKVINKQNEEQYVKGRGFSICAEANFTLIRLIAQNPKINFAKYTQKEFDKEKMMDVEKARMACLCIGGSYVAYSHGKQGKTYADADVAADLFLSEFDELNAKGNS